MRKPPQDNQAEILLTALALIATIVWLATGLSRLEPLVQVITILAALVALNK